MKYTFSTFIILFYSIFNNKINYFTNNSYNSYYYRFNNG